MGVHDTAEPRKARSGPGIIAHRLRDFTYLPRDLALARLGYGLKRPVFALPIYRYSLTGATPTALRTTPPDPWPGDASLGAAIIQGVFTFAGRTVSGPRPLWTAAGVEPGWLAELHGFDWLRDLRAAGGNVRELRNAMERAAVLVDGDEVGESLVRGLVATSEETENVDFELARIVADAERRVILKALDQTRDNKTEAAELLGIGERTLFTKLKKHGI